VICFRICGRWSTHERIDNRVYSRDRRCGDACTGCAVGAALSDRWLRVSGGGVGCGKTTLVRGLIQSLGYNGAVKSPTFTIMEPYDLGDREIYHLDLYRLADPEELEYLGIRDYLGDTALLLVEWPNLGAGVVPDPDLRVEIAYDGAARRVDLVAVTEAGHAAVRQFS